MSKSIEVGAYYRWVKYNDVIKILGLSSNGDLFICCYAGEEVRFHHKSSYLNYTLTTGELIKLSKLETALLELKSNT